MSRPLYQFTYNSLSDRHSSHGKSNLTANILFLYILTSGIGDVSLGKGNFHFVATHIKANPTVGPGT